MSIGLNSKSCQAAISALAFGALLLGATVASSQTAAPVTGEAPAVAAQAPAPSDSFGQARIVIVEWKIKKGREKEFLDYWAQKSVVADRTGLIAEFMSATEDRAKYPWIQWTSVDTSSSDYTPFYNVGIWKDADDFVGQIAKYIDINRPPLPFEADKRHRVLLAPQEWRVGMSKLPTKDADGVR